MSIKIEQNPHFNRLWVFYLRCIFVETIRDMKTREEIKKDISIIIINMHDQKHNSKNILRRLGAIEGMLLVLGKTKINEPLPFKETQVIVTGLWGKTYGSVETESYKDCILRLAKEVINE